MARERISYEIKLILILAIAAAVLMGAFFGLRIAKEKSENEAQQAIDDLKMTGLAQSVEVIDEESFTLVRDGIHWYCEEKPELEIRDSAAGIFADVLINFSAARALGDCSDKGDLFGFDKDARHIRLSTTDGVKEYVIGKYNTALDEYYITYVGTDEAFLIQRQYGTVLLEKVEDLLEKTDDEPQEEEEEQISDITVDPQIEDLLEGQD